MTQFAEVTNKTIWLTGAGSPIGQKLVERLTAHNNFVFVGTDSRANVSDADVLIKNYRDRNSIADNSNSLNRDNIFPMAFNMECEKQSALMSKKITEHTDHLDLVVACDEFCCTDLHSHNELDCRTYRAAMEANYFAAINTLNVALPLLRQSAQRGQVAFISSVTALAPLPNLGAYGASKLAFEYLLQSLMMDLQKENIDVTVARSGVYEDVALRNHFDKWIKIDINKAVDKILKGIVRRERFINVPSRISILLKLGAMMPNFWLNSVAPKLRRPEIL